MSLLSPQLQAFLAIVKHKTVHAAASSLHLTQTAVTQRLRALEDRLKVSLFIRTRRGMQLTHEGEALLHYCQAAKTLEGETLAHIKGGGKESIVKLAIMAPSTIMRSRIIPHCIPIMQQFPNLLLVYNVNDIEKRHIALKLGECDFTILSPEHISLELESKQLRPEEYVLVCTKKWANRPLKDIIKNERIIDFDETDQMTFNYLREYDLMKLAKTDRYFVNNIENLIELITHGLGYSVLTKEAFSLFEKSKRLMVLNQEKTFLNPVSLCWYPRPLLPSYFQAIITAIC